MCLYVCVCVRVCVCVCVCVCVRVVAWVCEGVDVSVAIAIVKRPVLPLDVEGGRSRNFLYYYCNYKCHSL